MEALCHPFCQDARELLAPFPPLSRFGDQECGWPLPQLLREGVGCRPRPSGSLAFSVWVFSLCVLGLAKLALPCPWLPWESLVAQGILNWPEGHRNGGGGASAWVHENYSEIFCGFQEIPRGVPGLPKVTELCAGVTL